MNSNQSVRSTSDERMSQNSYPTTAQLLLERYGAVDEVGLWHRQLTDCIPMSCIIRQHYNVFYHRIICLHNEGYCTKIFVPVVIVVFGNLCLTFTKDNKKPLGTKYLSIWSTEEYEPVSHGNMTVLVVLRLGGQRNQHDMPSYKFPLRDVW